MASGHLFIATSMDGFIARTDGGIEWLLERDDPSEDHGYDAFIADIGTILMGRGTFDSICHIRPWPYTRPVLVMSATLTADHIPDDLADKVAVTDKTPEAAMEMLGPTRVYVDGGRVIQSFLRAGLVADMVITRVPVLLGQGRSLFGPLAADIPLVHLGTQTFPSGLVQSRYRIAR